MSESYDAEEEILQDYITALGALTVWWASLESALFTTIERLSGLDTLSTECMLSNFERASGRATIVKMLALRPNPPSEDWQDCVVGLCDRISNEWGTVRNRLIHDDWHINQDQVRRTRIGRKIGKPDAINARKALLPLPPTDLTQMEIYDLTEKVMYAAIHLLFLSLAYESWRNTGKPVEVPPQAIWLSKDNQPALFPRDE